MASLLRKGAKQPPPPPQNANANTNIGRISSLDIGRTPSNNIGRTISNVDSGGTGGDGGASFKDGGGRVGSSVNLTPQTLNPKP